MTLKSIYFALVVSMAMISSHYHTRSKEYRDILHFVLQSKLKLTIIETFLHD